MTVFPCGIPGEVETASVVAHLKSDLGGAEDDPYHDPRWLCVRNGITQRFASDQQKRSTRHRIERDALAHNFRLDVDTLFPSKLLRQLAQRGNRRIGRGS